MGTLFVHVLLGRRADVMSRAGFRINEQLANLATLSFRGVR